MVESKSPLNRKQYMEAVRKELAAFEKRELEFKAKEREERLMQLGSLRQAVAEAVTQPTVAPSAAFPAAPAGEPRPSGGFKLNRQPPGRQRKTELS